MAKKKRKNRSETIIDYIEKHPIIVVMGLILLIIGFFEKISGITYSLIDFLYEFFSSSIIFNIVAVLLLIIAFFIIFRKLARSKKLIVIVFILFATPMFIALHQTYNLHQISDKTVIVIAEFDNKQVFTKADVSKISTLICDSLDTEKKNLNLASLRIEKVPTIIQNDEEAWKAGNKGIKKNAKTVIVIWGQYDDININTFFTVVKSPKKGIIREFQLEKKKGETLAELENFNLTYIRETLPDAMVFLTHFTLGVVYYWEENYDNAISQFNASLKKLPEDEGLKRLLYEVHFYMASSYYSQNDLTSAEKELRKAIEINPNDGNAHINLGIVYATQGKCIDAEKESKIAHKLFLEQGKIEKANLVEEFLNDLESE